MTEEAAAPAPILIKERDEGILVARMNRPERMNALSGGLLEALHDAWVEFRNDAGLKVMIITGVGERAFCAGADLRENDELARKLGAERAHALLELLRVKIGGITSNTLQLYKPVIAAINGWCVAGGCEIAMACDLRVIERHAKLGLPEIKRGMGAKATTHKLSYLTHLSAGLDIAWTGDPLSAERALELGLANDIAPTGQSVERAKQIAREICRRPVSDLHYHKERVFQSLGVPLAYALAMEQRFPPHTSEEYRRGLKASLESKLPGWPAS